MAEIKEGIKLLAKFKHPISAFDKISIIIFNLPSIN